MGNRLRKIRRTLEIAWIVAAFVVGALGLFLGDFMAYIARRHSYPTPITGVRKVCVVCSVLVIVLLLILCWLGVVG